MSFAEPKVWFEDMYSEAEVPSPNSTIEWVKAGGL